MRSWIERGAPTGVKGKDWEKRERLRSSEAAVTVVVVVEEAEGECESFVVEDEGEGWLFDMLASKRLSEPPVGPKNLDIP